MELALGSLMGEKVKLGTGEKQAGYAFRVLTLRRAAAAACLLSALLVLAVGFGYSAAIRERYNLYTATKSFESLRLRGDAANIAQNMQLEAALSAHEATRDDVVRLLKRIRAFAGKKAEEAKALVPREQARLAQQVGEVLSGVEQFVEEERTDFEREFEREHAKRVSVLEALRKKQTVALEKLLTRLTDVRLEALEGVLSDLFERVDDSVEVQLPEKLWEPLENLVDRVYMEQLKLPQALEQFDSQFRPFLGERSLPKEIEMRLGAARSLGELADTLDEIYEGVQIQQGREALKSVQARWSAAKSLLENIPSAARDEEIEAMEAAYTKATVDAVLAVQDLINSGKLPQNFLDFDSLALDRQDDDADQAVVEAEQEDRPEGDAADILTQLRQQA
jgi:hypothetical protein